MRTFVSSPLLKTILQVTSAVAYLHLCNIVHRDIKDENVIIDECFNCKLIDFGSAAYYGRGIKFRKFVGTLDYCPPEVLRGEPYDGPELDIWTMGILLYVLMYGRYPFSSNEEIVRCQLLLPHSRYSTSAFRCCFVSRNDM